MTLRENQSIFTRKVALLINFAYEKGIDLNLFINGKYRRTIEAHKELGKFWESIGGSWGGRFGDGNHYSLEYEERK